jgi:hypothetical protein
LAFVTFSTALLGSISLYRLSPLHPLAKYPGPTRCKLTKIWMAWISFGGRAHIYYKTLHDKYGPIVRIGESLSDIFDWKHLLLALCLLFRTKWIVDCQCRIDPIYLWSTRATKGAQ